MLDGIGNIWSTHALPMHAAVITDTGVPRGYLAKVVKRLRGEGVKVLPLIIAQGERQKSLRRSQELYTWLIRNGYGRSSALVALGGGVVGDLTGYVAATFRRGISYLQVPTTLLAQVESSIGGKTGVNLGTTKNAVGAFHQPRCVVSDVSLLRTLAKRELMCGLGELLKYAYLAEESFQYIDEPLDGIMLRDPAILTETLVRCVSSKARMIAEDEREELPAGGRMVLNLGHTIGHALEVLSNYRLKHGEAVLTGLRWELECAMRSSVVTAESYERLRRLLGRVPYAPKVGPLSRRRIVDLIFGKRSVVKFVLPRSIGAVQKIELDRRVVDSVLAGVVPALRT